MVAMACRDDMDRVCRVQQRRPNKSFGLPKFSWPTRMTLKVRVTCKGSEVYIDSSVLHCMTRMANEMHPRFEDSAQLQTLSVGNTGD